MKSTSWGLTLALCTAACGAGDTPVTRSSASNPILSAGVGAVPVVGRQAGSGGGGAAALPPNMSGLAQAGTRVNPGLQPGTAGRGPLPGSGFQTMPAAGSRAVMQAAAGAAAAGPVAGMGPAAGSGAPGGPVSSGPDDHTPEGVCARWKMDRADLSEGTWSGDVASCDPGDISPEGRANALKLVNLYRWLADLPAVTDDPEMDRQAQACALLQRANNSLSHMPPASWKCYMDEGAQAAGRCNISTGPGVSSVDGYMLDPGNPTTIGHRRWILSNSFGPTGIGSTDQHSCLMTFGNSRAGKLWMAWPAPGAIPLQAMQGAWGQSVDSTGWTVQSDTINLGSAQVSVTADGEDKPVMVTQLSGGYGSRYAIRFNPMGWQTTAGTTYTVSVKGGSQPIDYQVQIVDCK